MFVLPNWDFVSRPDQLGLPNHLFTAAQKAAEEFFDVPRSDGEPVLLLAGGWSYEGISDLIELSREFESFGTTSSVPGLIALSLDMDAYARALTAASGQP